MSKKITVGSLFAGIGGICQAFKNSKCEIVWANEIDPKACITYKLNHPNVRLIETDVKKLSKKNLEPIDILTAGFPCQPFSQAGHGKGFDDERGQLFFEVVRLLKELKPAAYFLENVRTLATHKAGNTFRIIKSELANAGYSFIPFILKSSEHTEIPQGRERIYIVGFRNEANYTFEKPVKINKNCKVTNANLSQLFNIPIKNANKAKSIEYFLDRSSVQENDLYSDTDNKIHRIILEHVREKNTVYQYRRYYIRKNKSNVCPTLTANMGGGGHNIPIILDNGVPRRLTPKECFNLQGFSKDFKLPSNIARIHLYKQAGNSVVVPMVQKIANEIVRVLDENSNR